MTRIAFRSPVTTPLHRRGQCSVASDDFCVTQQFNDPDYYQSQRVPPPNPLPTHNATDIGNFRCGYPIVAMAAGTAWRVQDNATALGAASNALGIVIDHGSGVKSAYWHLASWTAPNGSWVNPGQEIGRLGNTGLLAICHCHIELSVNGLRIDPEPHMFGAPLLIGEDEIMFDPANVVGLYGTRLRALPGANIRSEPSPSAPIIANFPAGFEFLRGVAKITAEVAGVGELRSADWWAFWIEVEGKTQIAYGHTSALIEVPLPTSPATDCTVQVNAAKQATADKANAQMDAWTAQRPKIAP